MQQAAFREHMSYAPAKEFNKEEESLYSDAKPCDGLWNEEVRLLNLILAMMISPN